MRISYRISSIVVVLVVLGMFLLPNSLLVRPIAPTRALVDGTVSLDPCFTIWGQSGWLIRLSALVWIGTFLYLLVQGFRNRTVPLAVAIVSLVAFGLSLHNQLWRVQHCDANLGIIVFWVWITAVGLMCVHHILQRLVRA
jgi:hypothetical protein